MKKQTIETTQQLDPISKWFGESFSYVKENLKMLFKVYLWGMLVYVGISFLMVVVAGILVFAAVKLGATWNFLTILLTGISSVAAFLVLLSFAGKMVLLQINAIQQPIVNVRERWRQISLKEGLSLYWLVLLACFVVYGGFVFLIIPGIIVAVWISLSMFVKVNEGIGGLKALITSRDYTKGYFWPLLGRFLLYGVGMIILMFASMELYTKMQEMGTFLGVIGYIIYMLTTFVLTMIAYRLNYALYLNLKEIKGKVEPQISAWRKFRWSLLAGWPIVFIVIVAFIAAVNPAAQIEKAQDLENSLNSTEKTQDLEFDTNSFTE